GVPRVAGVHAVPGVWGLGRRFGRRVRPVRIAVTLNEMVPGILPVEDEELPAGVAKELGRRGVAIRTGTSVTGVTAAGDSVRIALRTGAGEETLEADYALVAVGRAPVVDGLGLEAVGRAPGAGGGRGDGRVPAPV